MLKSTSVPRSSSRRFQAPVVCTLLLCFGLASALPQACAQSDPQVQTQPRPTSTPYRGDLSIFEEPGRDQRLEIGRVMDLLHLTPGKSVADIGAGSGWFTVRAARRVAPGGAVLAALGNRRPTSYGL